MFLQWIAGVAAKAWAAHTRPFVPKGTPAFQRGFLDYGDNPYPQGSAEHAEWEDGAEEAFFYRAI